MEDQRLMDALRQIGFTGAESKVYISLLSFGESTAGPIADRSGTAPSKIYNVLGKLIAKGIATEYSQGNVRHFKAVSPGQILRYLEEEKEEISRKAEVLKGITGQLKAIEGAGSSVPEAVIYRGPRGIRTAFNELVGSLSKGDTINIMGVYDFGERFRSHAIYFQRIRSEKGIKANFLINRGAERIAEVFSGYPPVEIRFMDKGVFTPVIFLIYKNKVIINLGDDLVFFVLTSSRASQGFNAYFSQMWKAAEKYSPKKSDKRAMKRTMKKKKME